ncbi:type-1 angiotensin II receptor-associated protein isoform 2-T2 [Leptodactylus fuscus]
MRARSCDAADHCARVRRHGGAGSEPQGDCLCALAVDHFFMIGLVITIVLDILLLALFYASAEQISEKSLQRDLFRFSGGMAILNLILKPLSCFFIYHMYLERGGECNISLGFVTVSRDRSTYQTIDHTDTAAEQDKLPSRY